MELAQFGANKELIVQFLLRDGWIYNLVLIEN